MIWNEMESTVAGVIPRNMPCSTSVRILESLKYPCLDRLSCSWLSEELKGHCVVSYYGAVLYLVQADRRFYGDSGQNRDEFNNVYCSSTHWLTIDMRRSGKVATGSWIFFLCLSFSVVGYCSCWSVVAVVIWVMWGLLIKFFTVYILLGLDLALFQLIVLCRYWK